jgi:hypothetical protein
MHPVEFLDVIVFALLMDQLRATMPRKYSCLICKNFVYIQVVGIAKLTTHLQLVPGTRRCGPYILRGVVLN